MHDVSVDTFSNFVDWLIFGDLRAIEVIQEQEMECMESNCVTHREPATKLTRLLIFGDRIQCSDLVNCTLDWMFSITTFWPEDLDVVKEIYDHTTLNHPFRDFLAAWVSFSLDCDCISLGELHTLGGKLLRDFLPLVCEQQHKFNCIKHRHMDWSDLHEYYVSY